MTDPGTVQLALDAAGTILVGDPAEVVDGKATFVIPASEFEFGLRTVHAIYVSDDEQRAGTSPTALAPGAAHPDGDHRRARHIRGLRRHRLEHLHRDGELAATALRPARCTSSATRRMLNAAGEATIELSMLGVRDDPYDIVAEYRGDGVYGRGASDSVEFSMTAASSTTEITGVAPAAPEYGEAVAVTVTVRAVAPSTADPQGWVTVIADGPDLDEPVEFGPVSFDPFAQDGDGSDCHRGRDSGGGPPGRRLHAGRRVRSPAPTSPARTRPPSRTPSSPSPRHDHDHHLDVQPTSTVFGEELTLTATVDAERGCVRSRGHCDLHRGCPAPGHRDHSSPATLRTAPDARPRA